MSAESSYLLRDDVEHDDLKVDQQAQSLRGVFTCTRTVNAGNGTLGRGFLDAISKDNTCKRRAVFL